MKSCPSLSYLFHVKTMLYIFIHYKYTVVLPPDTISVLWYHIIYFCKSMGRQKQGKNIVSLFCTVFVQNHMEYDTWVMQNCPCHSCLSFSFSLALSQWVPVKHQLSMGLRLSLPVSTPKNSSVHSLRLPLSHCFHFLSFSHWDQCNVHSPGKIHACWPEQRMKPKNRVQNCINT